MSVDETLYYIMTCRTTHRCYVAVEIVVSTCNSADEQYFLVALFRVLTFESVYVTPKCDHSNESYGTVLFYYTMQFERLSKCVKP